MIWIRRLDVCLVLQCVLSFCHWWCLSPFTRSNIEFVIIMYTLVLVAKVNFYDLLAEAFKVFLFFSILFGDSNEISKSCHLKFKLCIFLFHLYGTYYIIFLDNFYRYCVRFACKWAHTHIQGLCNVLFDHLITWPSSVQSRAWQPWCFITLQI